MTVLARDVRYGDTLVDGTVVTSIEFGLTTTGMVVYLNGNEYPTKSEVVLQEGSRDHG